MEFFNRSASGQITLDLMGRKVINIPFTSFTLDLTPSLSSIILVAFIVIICPVTRAVKVIEVYIDPFNFLLPSM